MFRQLVLGTIVLVSAGCATGDQVPVAEGGAQGVVSGQASYRERIALPPGTQLEVLLEDVSRADTRAEIIGSVSVTNVGNPPYLFSIPYERARIIAAHHYAVRARLTHEGRLLFTTDQSYPVITSGNGTEVTLLLRSAAQTESIAPPVAQFRTQSLGVLPATFKGDLPCADCSAIQYQLDLFADNSYDLLMIYRGKSGSSESRSGSWEKSGVNGISLLGGRTKLHFAIISANSLRLLNQNGGPIESTLNYTLTRDTQTPNIELLNTAWRLTRLTDQPARRFPNQREPQIVLRSDGTVAGSDGCNRITGGYRHAGTSLSFTQIAATRMACMNGMDQAGRFTNSLGNVARYYITGRHLELFDATEILLMRFEAVLVR